ncbi:MAG: hypothetical protein Q9198_005879 [Flavoplaca austrocitrina]
MAASQLSTMQQLSPSVYLWEPSSHDAATSIHPPHCPAPKLILLFTWMSAQPIHISKYISGYQIQYPTTPIFTIRSSPLDFLYHSLSTQRQRLSPAISYLFATLQPIAALHPTTAPSNTTNDPEVLIHILSNGGSHQFCTFVSIYQSTTTTAFPPHIKILDSCPGRATFRQSVLAFSSPLYSLPFYIRFPTLVLIYLLLGVYFMAIRLRLLHDPILRIRMALNSRSVAERRRCYIYSKADPMVGWRDVEVHAMHAAEKGCMVRRERFESTGHCAHVREGGGGRYWGIVKRLWEDQGEGGE